MFVRDLIQSCLRRWYLVVVGLLMTGAASYLVFQAVPPTYEAKASMVLVPPQVAVTTGENPFLYLGGLDQALGVLQVKVTGPEVAEPLLEEYPGTAITVAQDESTTGPIIVADVTGPDALSTMGMLEAMKTTIPSTLATLQTDLDVPKASVITVLPLAADASPTVVYKKPIQFTGIVTAMGLAATFLLVGLADGFLERRKMRKSRPNDLVSVPQLSTLEGEWEHHGHTPGKPQQGKGSQPAKSNRGKGSPTTSTPPETETKLVGSRRENRR
ncbi:hypothetical protein JTF08_02080 [Micrococcaceae bacterium RIT802]|nr:hypothetical protein [Micrococcaceae bacterium RIT 802]